MGAGSAQRKEVEARARESREHALRDVIGDLVEREAHRELRSHLGDWEAGRLAREGGGAADARVHLDDDHLARLRVRGELDVAAAALDAHLADDRDARVPQPLHAPSVGVSGRRS